MKKRSLFFTCIALVVAMVMVLCGCSTYGKIKSAYEDAGYTESDSLTAVQDEIMKALNTDSEEEIEQICTIHVFTKDYVNVAIIFEFKTTEEMNEKISESDTLKGAIKDAQNSDYVNGNCLLFPLCTPAVKTVFTGTK